MTKAQALVIEIQEIKEHTNADALELCIVGGYQIVVKKGSLKVGDKALYISVDSIVPTPILEHHGIAQYVSKNRIKTIKLRGEYSQGLVLPLTYSSIPSKVKVGDDLADTLGIVKYIPPVNSRTSGKSGKPKPKWAKPIAKFLNACGIQSIKRYIPWRIKQPLIDIGIFDFRNFWPTGLHIYDIENIQNPKFMDVFKEGDTVVATEKIHGRHVVAGYWKGEFFVGSRKINIDRPYKGKFDVNWNPVMDANLESKLNAIRKELGHDDIAIRGENYGPNCQGSKFLYGENKDVFVAFDIECPFGNYLPYEKFQYFCDKYEIPQAPLKYYGVFDYKKLAEIAEEDSSLAQRNGGANLKHIQEGLVIKCPNETKDVKLGRKQLKLISPKYKLENDDEQEVLDE